MLSLIFSLIEEAIKIEPALAAELSAIFSKPNPTPDDWAALRAKVLGESFEQIAPEAAANVTPPTVEAEATAAAEPAEPSQPAGDLSQAHLE